MAVYLAVDLGTTGCRSILFDENLTPVSSAYEEYGLITPHEGWVEQDAELWWTLTLQTAKAAIEKGSVNAKEIAGISVSSQGITVVPVNEQFIPLTNAHTWLDTRAVKQTREIGERYSVKELFAHTGKRLDPCYTLPKLLWFKEELPEVFSRAYKFLMPLDFLTARLTGKALTDYSMASGTLFYDIAKGEWSDEVLTAFGVPKEKLPEIAAGGSLVGRVLPAVAKELGLSPDCPVALGVQDQKCAAFGVGLDKETVSISLGTAAAVTRLWDTPDTERQKIGWSGYVTKDAWVTEGVVNTAGTALRYLRELMYRGEDYKTVDEEAERAIEAEHTLFFYPYLNGPSSPDYYDDATGVFHGVTLGTERGAFAAAVLEGIAYQIRILLEEMQAYGTVKRLVIFGGGAKSKLWCQIMSDVTGLELFVPTTAEAAGAGAARLASMAGGSLLPPLSVRDSYKPGKWAAAYEEKYRRYRMLEKRIFSKEDKEC